MDVTVTFDPCALRGHHWRPATFGLAAAVGAEQCSRCGETHIPDGETGGIDRAPVVWNWRPIAS